MKFIAYPKIPQFSNVVRGVQMHSDYKGRDDEGNPIYEQTERPTITFKGTVKLHGTNAGICYAPGEGIKPQKRSSFLNGFSGHFNFGVWVKGHEEELTQLMESIHKANDLSSDVQITVFGEWAGQGIQKGVGISQLPKGFYLFGIRAYDRITEDTWWIDSSDVSSPLFKNIDEFVTYEIDIDFNNPGISQNKLVEITTKIEEACPVSSALGESGIGEGAVWTGTYKDQRYIFKVKGEKHSVTKVKKLASVDPEVVKNISEFVDYACTVNRVEQGIQETGAKDRSDTGALLKWIANDIIAEESTTLSENGLEWKQVAGEVSRRARTIFFNKIDAV